MGGMMNGGFNHYFDNYWLMGGPTGLLINVAIIVGVVLLIVWVVQKFSRSVNQNSSFNNNPSARYTLSAREILDIRYARGELSREEYQTMLGDIS